MWLECRPSSPVRELLLQHQGMLVAWTSVRGEICCQQSSDILEQASTCRRACCSGPEPSATAAICAHGFLHTSSMHMCIHLHQDKSGLPGRSLCSRDLLRD